MKEKLRTLILKPKIINEVSLYEASVLIKDEHIEKIYKSGENIPPDILDSSEIIDASGKYLMPGVIDDQVHFRDPGLTYKGDFESESRAALAGGTTYVMDMPNTNPRVLTRDLLLEKKNSLAKKSLVAFSLYMGTSNNNIEEVLKVTAEDACGVKIFLGSSTGDMLVNNKSTLEKLFKEVKLRIAVHCEDDEIILENLKKAQEKYGDNIPISAHPGIRSVEACYASSSMAVDLAKRCGTKLHVLHLTTAKEMNLFEKPNSSLFQDWLSKENYIKNKQVTNEVCVHHLWFSDEDYERLGAKIKCNPAIKSKKDRDALRKALVEDRVDVVATDHAPHSWKEKQNPYLNCPSGIPLVQHSLLMMLELYHQGIISLEKIVEKMCHNPALIFGLKDRGFIREGYRADLVLVDLDSPWVVSKENILYKCGWSPLEGYEFKSKIDKVFQSTITSP
jgi:dihydroorotase